MTLKCVCGATNRIPSLPGGARIRCGACKHVFTPAELVKATNEPPPKRPDPTDLSAFDGDDDDYGDDEPPDDE